MTLTDLVDQLRSMNTLGEAFEKLREIKKIRTRTRIKIDILFAVRLG